MEAHCEDIPEGITPTAGDELLFATDLMQHPIDHTAPFVGGSAQSCHDFSLDLADLGNYDYHLILRQECPSPYRASEPLPYNLLAHLQNDYGSHPSPLQGFPQYIGNTESIPPNLTILNSSSRFYPASPQLVDAYSAIQSNSGVAQLWNPSELPMPGFHTHDNASPNPDPGDYPPTGAHPDYPSLAYPGEHPAQAQFEHHKVTMHPSTGTIPLDMNSSLLAVLQDRPQPIGVYHSPSDATMAPELRVHGQLVHCENRMPSGVGTDLLITSPISETIVSNGIYSNNIPREREIVPQAQGTSPLPISTVVNHGDSSVTPRKRKTITGAEPTKSRIKPCRWCQVAKVKCTEPPCKRCFKQYGLLAMTLCVRYDKAVHDIRKSIKDFYSLNDRPHLEVTTSDDTTAQTLILAHPLQQIGNQVVYFPEGPKLEVICYKYKGVLDLNWLPTKSFMTLNMSWKSFEADLGLQGLASIFNMSLPPLRSYTPQPDTYVLDPASLPTYKTLVEWGDFDNIYKHNIAPTDVESALTAFLAAYADKQRHPQLEHRDFVRKVLDLISLGRMFDGRQPVEWQGQCSDLSAIAQNGPDQARSTHSLKSMSAVEFNNWKKSGSLPGPISLQLFTHLVKLIQPLELEILAEIDKYIAKRDKANGLVGDPLIFGLCIRRLCLHYRRGVLWYRKFRLEKDSYYENNKLILEELTKHYAHVFKGTLSPFHDEWRAEKHESLLGHDLKLQTLLKDLKAAEHYHFLNEQDNVFDNLYKRLVTEHQTKCHSTLAKQWLHCNYSFSDSGLVSVEQPFQRWVLPAEDLPQKDAVITILPMMIYKAP